MVDELHILIQNRTKKPLRKVLNGAGRESRGRDSGSDLTNVQYKLIWNYHNEFPLVQQIYPNKKISEKKFTSSEQFLPDPWNSHLVVNVNW
jgi:hypothetical protein